MSIHLRRTTEADLDFVLAAEQNEENRPFIGSWTRAQHHAALSDQDLGHFIVARDIDDRPVGYIILAGLAQVQQSIEFRRIVITEKHKGYGRKTLRLVKKMAFEAWHAHRLWLDVRDHNLRARHVYETEGFVTEGVLRECIKTGEGFESLVVMSMLQGEYRETRHRQQGE